MTVQPDLLQSNAGARAGRWRRRLLIAYSTLVLVFLIAPILAIVPLSFNAGSFLTYPLYPSRFQ